MAKLFSTLAYGILGFVVFGAMMLWGLIFPIFWLSEWISDYFGWSLEVSFLISVVIGLCTFKTMLEEFIKWRQKRFYHCNNSNNSNDAETVDETNVVPFKRDQ